MMNVPANRIAVKGYEHNGVQYRKLIKQSWGKTYRSMDEGATWHRKSSEAFSAAQRAGKLQQMPAADLDFLANGGVILA